MTSRQRPRVRGERLAQVHPLPIPSSEAADDAAASPAKLDADSRTAAATQAVRLGIV